MTRISTTYIQQNGKLMQDENFVYTRGGRKFMTIEMFLGLLVDYGVLTLKEKKIAFGSGILPDDILQRLNIREIANNN
jgi:hypothetical protein